MNWVRTIAVLLLLAALLFSVTELFDTWDNTPQTGNDVEYNAVFVILCVGAAIACFRAIWIAMIALKQLPFSQLRESLLGSDYVTLAVNSFTPPEMTSLRI